MTNERQASHRCVLFLPAGFPSDCSISLITVNDAKHQRTPPLCLGSRKCLHTCVSAFTGLFPGPLSTSSLLCISRKYAPRAPLSSAFYLFWARRGTGRGQQALGGGRTRGRREAKALLPLPICFVCCLHIQQQLIVLGGVSSAVHHGPSSC